MSARATLLVLAVVLALLGGSCGGDEEVIRIGLLVSCGELALSGPGEELAKAGAELPLLRRGGSLRGPGPLDGVEGATVAGRPVELLFGCASEPTEGTVEARRLVEEEGVDLLVGSNVYTLAPPLVRYAARQPEVTFVITNGGTVSNLSPGPNVFRFSPTDAQLSAGLGTYAYEELGWRRAITIGWPDLGSWGAQAGFVAEFCALGGEIVERVWLDSRWERWPELLADVPSEGIDGYYLTFFALRGADTFLARQQDPASARTDRVIAGGYSFPTAPDVVKRLESRLIGLASAWDIPFAVDPPAPAFAAYSSEFTEAFPELADPAHFFDLPYHNAMEAVLLALEKVDADLSAGQRRFRGALAATDLDAPNGRIRLDEHRQAIVSVHLYRVTGDEPFVRPLRTINDVDASFGGRFGPGDPPPSRSEPPCEPGSPPPWALTGSSE